MRATIEKRLAALRARDILSRRLVFVRAHDTMRQAAKVLLENNISGAPVLNESGRPVGVLTKTDLVRYEREFMTAPETEVIRNRMRTLDTLEIVSRSAGFHVEQEEDLVEHWMTPKVYTVKDSTHLFPLAREMGRKGIHRIFVQNNVSDGLLGVITTFDIMKCLGGLTKNHSS